MIRLRSIWRRMHAPKYDAAWRWTIGVLLGAYLAILVGSLIVRLVDAFITAVGG